MLWWSARRAQTAALQQLQRALTTAAESALLNAQNAARLHAVASAETDALLLLAPNGTVLQLNQPAQLLFGSAAAGHTLLQATHLPQLDELLTQALAARAPADQHLQINGQPHHAFVALAGAAGEHGAVLLVQDLTELERLGRARRDFVANISHELRTPITSIRLIADTLRHLPDLDSQRQHSLLEKIAIETEALGQLSGELLDLAQIESGQVQPSYELVAVRDLLATVYQRLQALAHGKALHVQIEASPALHVRTDPLLLERTLVNLLHNAVKFTPAGGAITLLARIEEPRLLLGVIDGGNGIPPLELPRIFERFYRGDPARSKGGTGLGLAIAKHAVELLGGSIWAESSGAPGAGAAFYIKLPFP
ncbi:MAG: ATP-binding protein [Chloroflexi bacterium]|nr:ATP-binding protein [Chloroflexota bacterium]